MINQVYIVFMISAVEEGEGANDRLAGETALTLALPEHVFDVLVERAASLAVERLDQPREYMTSDEVAAYLHWSKKRIDHLCSAGTIPFRKIGGRRAFIRQEIDDWVDAQPGITTPAALLSL
jgi:excisionase family DNA binding protein